jgi:Cof subfamily protein (haloacid dehalogenase superfamily)
MKTLYVSDLDGTLLNSDEVLSTYTKKTINDLVEEKGMIFSYATARSFITASKATKGLNAKLPLIVYNGSIIVENETKKILMSNFFKKTEVEKIKSLLIAAEVHPIVYSFINDKEYYRYIRKDITEGAVKYLNTRQGDIRDNPAETEKELYDGNIFYFTCIDKEDQLKQLYDKLKDNYYCVFHKDIYTHEHWLEIMPKAVSKANAIKQLKEYLGCDYVVAFGDAKNDIEMFEYADECYAVSNATSELKKLATGIIDSNNEDGVAKWLCQRFNDE